MLILLKKNFVYAVTSTWTNKFIHHKYWPALLAAPGAKAQPLKDTEPLSL